MANPKYTGSRGNAPVSGRGRHRVVRNGRHSTNRDGQLLDPSGHPLASASEPPAKIVIDPPLAEPLASREWRLSRIALKTHIVPVFVVGCLAARRTHSCESRRCLMGVGQMRVKKTESS